MEPIDVTDGCDIPALGHLGAPHLPGCAGLLYHVTTSDWICRLRTCVTAIDAIAVACAA